MAGTHRRTVDKVSSLFAGLARFSVGREGGRLIEDVSHGRAMPGCDRSPDRAATESVEPDQRRDHDLTGRGQNHDSRGAEYPVVAEDGFLGITAQDVPTDRMIR